MCLNAWHTLETWSCSQWFPHPAREPQFLSGLAQTSWAVTPLWPMCYTWELLLLNLSCSLPALSRPLPHSPTIVPFPRNSLAGLSVLKFFSQAAEYIVLKNPWDSCLGFNFFRDLTFHGGKRENNEQQEVPSTQKGIPPNSVAVILISWPVGIVKWKVLSPFWELSQVEPVFANWEDLTEPTKSG